MIQKKKTGIKINDREIEVSELKVKHVDKVLQEFIELSRVEKSDIEVLDDMKNFVLELLPECVNITREEFGELGFGALEKLEDAFKEVNAPLFRYLERLGILKALKSTNLLTNKGSEE